MGQNSLKKYIKNNECLIDTCCNEPCVFEVDGEELNGIEKIVVPSNSNITLVLFNIPKTFDTHFEVMQDAFLNVKGLIDENMDNCKISANVHQNGEFNGYFVDFSDEKCYLRIDVNLLEKASKCVWKMASLSANKDNKKFDININHIGVETDGLVDNYGVCKDNSILEFCGTSWIKENAHQTKTIQNAKIMVLDETANGIAKPILKIDHNDVQASHSACIGQINEDHLFYLISRGLSKEEAERLIVLGYFNPIIKLFETTSLIEKINELMEKRV